MGGVDFRYLIPPRSGGATRYQESFNRADQPFFLGNNWNFQVTDACANAPSVLAGGVNVAAFPAGATIGAAGGGTARSIFTPAFVDRQLITTLSASRGEYSQFTIKGSLAGVSCAVGPVVFNPSPNDGNCYMMVLQSNGQTADLFRGVGSSAASLVVGTFAWVATDIVRLEVIPGVGSNTVRSIKNGVVQNSFVDNNAARPLSGHYGIGWFSSNVGTISFGDYDGGLL